MMSPSQNVRTCLNLIKLNESNKTLLVDESSSNVLKNCLNNVTVRHRHSVWTMLTDGDGYALSALKLLDSVRRNTNYSFDANILELKNKPLRPDLKEKLVQRGWRVCQVERIPARSEDTIYHRFRDQFAKFHLWRMTEYESVVYFDSDCFIIGNIDHLFQVHKKIEASKKSIAVARDIMAGVWLKTFNMGVFVISPSRLEYNRLISIKNDASFEFNVGMAEQGFLNTLYKDTWLELDFIYNANLAAYTQQPKFWKEREKNIRVIHFTMSKPWECGSAYQNVCKFWAQFS